MTDFAKNLKLMHKYLSTWVAFAASATAAYWMQLSIADQQALLAAYPAIKVTGPVLSFVAFIVARGVPQFPSDPGHND